MGDSDVYQSDPNFEPSHASQPSFKDASGEPLTGRAGRESLMGYHQTKSEPEEKIYEGPDAVRDAARDVGRERRERGDAGPDEIVERKQHVPHDAVPGAKYATTVKQAAEQLSEDHRIEDFAHAAENLNQLQGEVDVARYLANAVAAGQISPEAAREIEAQVNREMAEGTLDQHAEQPVQAESPQPEASEPPRSGLSPKAQAALQHALSDPEVRAAIEQPLLHAQQARQHYENRTEHLANATMAAVVAQFPELGQYTAAQLPAVLNYMAQSNPERYQEINNHLNKAGAILGAAHQAKAVQAQRAQAEFQSWAKAQDDAFEKSLGTENSPEKRRRCKRKSTRPCVNTALRPSS